MSPRPTRRQFLSTAPAAVATGLSSADLARLRAAGPPGRHTDRACVLLFLFGGPSHIDLWDMKPDAPDQVRGEFRPAATRVPGLRVCEHLPGLAGVMDKVCLVRSMTHRMNVHGPACSEVLTGRPYFGPPTTDQASREDWPSLAALVARFGSARGGLPPAAVLPWYLQFPGQSRRIAGQTGGRMGEAHNPLLVAGDIADPAFEVVGLRASADRGPARLDDRRRLLDRLDGRIGIDPSGASLARARRAAHDLVGGRAADAFDLHREPRAVRDRYGPTAVGQSLLLARRLVEAGVSLVTVNWQDETRVDGVNTCWDTHQDNFAKLKNLLCPTFDRAFPAFVEDLDQRGLLGRTLVVAVGEFGRTPKLGQFTQSSNTRSTGRDHWPHAFSALLAGGGVRGGQAYGGTTRDGGYVADRPVTPADLTATLLAHLGVDPAAEYVDEFQHLRNRLSDGRPVRDLG